MPLGSLYKNTNALAGIIMEGTHFLRHILHAPFDIADRKKQAAFLI